MTRLLRNDYHLVVVLKRSYRVIFLLVLALLATSKIEAASPKPDKAPFEIGPTPGWVKPLEPASALPVGVENIGIVYLLIDHQENLERHAYYYHEVYGITSENGVQNSGSVSTSFDPAFEKLTLHSVRITRGGTTLNRLDRSRVNIQPREKDPERSVYDTSYTAQLTLDDVRVGDVVEFAFSREGANPFAGKKYAATYRMQWDVPVARNTLRLIYSGNRKLTFRSLNGAAQPVVMTSNGMTELWYEAKNISPRKVEDNVPDDYMPFQQLELTEFRDWADLGQWAMPLFDYATPGSSEFQSELKALRAILDPADRIVSALRFVQEEIRSVSVASSTGDRALTPPDEVLRRRFANHFDKALLLVSLLRGIDIDAAPALVGTSYRDTLKTHLPSPDLFNHVIVQVRLGQELHWIDPWRDAQRGPLTQLYVARLGYALVLRPGSGELTEFRPPPDSLPVRKVIENFIIPSPGNVADLEVVTEYHGLAADRSRASFREHTREQIQKDYVQYYARTYPEIKPTKLLWYEEIPGQDACRVSEFYEIPKVWQLDEKDQRYTLTVQPGDISSALGSPASSKRNDPLGLEYITVTEEMNFQMFNPWSIDTKDQDISNDFFRLHDQPVVDGAHVQFNYTFEMLKDRVRVNEFSTFNDAVQKAKDSLGYTLTYSTPEQLAKKRPKSTFNWAVGAAVGCFFGTGSFIFFRYFRNSKLLTPLPPPVSVPPGLNGIAGWLILLAIGHVLQPIGFLKGIYDSFATCINTNSWRALTDPIEVGYNPWWAPSLLFDLFFNITSLLFCLLLIALFFARRAVWPRCFVIFWIGSALGIALEYFLTRHIPSAKDAGPAAIRQIIPVFLGAAIWFPYVYRSKRVKSTFRY